MPLDRPRDRSLPPPSQSRRGRRRDSLTAASQQLQEKIEQSPIIGEGWQREAWEAYEAVPELRTAARITGNAMSQCRLVLARVSAEGEPSPLDPHELEQHPAAQLLAEFAGGMGGQSEMLDALGVYLTVTGESIIVGNLDPAKARIDPNMQMHAYSPEQVQLRANGVILRKSDTTRADVKLDPLEYQPIRLWRPHPRFQWQADSAARAALPLLREIMLYDAHLRATGLSRLAGAGMFFVPEGITLPGRPAEEDGDGPDDDPFMRLLMEVMGTAIRDRESAAALVPILIRAETEDIAGTKFMDFATAFDEKIMELRSAAIDRLAVAVDMPGELLTGLGDTQHWTGSLVTDNWVANDLAALMGLVCGSLTTGWLYPAMAEQAAAAANNMPEADLIIWFDSSSLRTRPNVAPDAMNLFDRKAIGFTALRRSSGFDQGDAPQPQELYLMLALEAMGKDPAILPDVARLLGISDPNIVQPTSAPGTPKDVPADDVVSPPAPGAQPPPVAPEPVAPNPTTSPPPVSPSHAAAASRVASALPATASKAYEDALARREAIAAKAAKPKRKRTSARPAVR